MNASKIPLLFCQFVICLWVIQSPSIAQYKTNLGVRAGWNSNFFKIQPDDPNVFAGSPLIPSILSATLDFRIGESNHYLQLGFDAFGHYLHIKTIEEQHGLAPGFTDIMNFSFGYKKRIVIVSKRLFISPEAGFQMGQASGGGMIGTVRRNTSQGMLTYQLELPIRRDQLITMLYAGLNLETCFKNGMILSLHASYHQGFRKIFDDEISYFFNNDPPTTLRFFTRGSHMPVQLGLSYPISRIWEGKIDIE